MPVDFPNVKNALGKIFSSPEAPTRRMHPSGLGGLVDYDQPRSFYLAQDTIKYIDEAKRNVFDPSAYARCVDQARAKQTEFEAAETAEVPLNAAGQQFLHGNDSTSLLSGEPSGTIERQKADKDSANKKRVLKSFKELESLHQQYTRIVQSLEYVEETGRIRRGAVTNLRQPDIISLLRKTAKLSQQVRAMHTHIIERNLMAEHVAALEDRITDALKMSVHKYSIKTSDTNLRKLFKTETPQMIYAYIDSKIQDLGKLQDRSQRETLATKIKQEHLQPLADGLYRHLARERRANSVPTEKTFELQTLATYLEEFLRDRDHRWDTTAHSLSAFHGQEPSGTITRQTTLVNSVEPSSYELDFEDAADHRLSSATLEELIYASRHQYDPQEAFDLNN